MSQPISKDTVVQWNAAVDAFNSHRVKDALELFCTIADISKIHFNIGVCCLNLFDYQKAELAFTMAIEADQYFAIALYHRGWVYTQLKQYSKALRDYIQAYMALRKNSSINYRQIGLEFDLYAADICINAGLCTVLLKDVSKARFHFKKGLQLGDEAKKQKCERALELKEKAPTEVSFMFAPVNLIFIPQTDQISSTQDVDYLGRSTVISENKEITGNKDAIDDLASENFLFDYCSEAGVSPTSKSPAISLSRVQMPLRPPTTPMISLSDAAPELPPRSQSMAMHSLSRSPSVPSSSMPTESSNAAAFNVKRLQESLNPEKKPQRIKQRSNTTPSKNLGFNTFSSGDALKIDTAPSKGLRTYSAKTASDDLMPQTKKGTIQIEESMGLILNYKNQQRSLIVPVNYAFTDLTLHIQNKLDLDINFKITYKDQYGDPVVITDDEDLRLCIHIWKGMNREGDVQLYVIDD